MKNPHYDDRNYRGNCAAMPLIQKNYTGMSDTICDDPHNVYVPCESDNGGAVVAHQRATNTLNVLAALPEVLAIKKCCWLAKSPVALT